MTIAETCMQDVAPPRSRRRQLPQQQQQAEHVGRGDGGMRAPMDGAAGIGPADGGECPGPATRDGGASGGEGECRAAPPRIKRSTKMTRRIQNLYGDADADKRIMCRQCSGRIAVGSAMRRVKRTGRCWHEECYMQARRGGLIPPKIRSVRTMTKRIKKLYGGGDDHSVLCQMCGVEIEIGARLRRDLGTKMCWHEQCYRMTWSESMHRAVAPPRPAYKISDAKWKRMRSECMQCVGSRLCDYHRRIEAECRVPRDSGEAVAVAAPAASNAGAATAR